jgi:phosphopantothenoylcysteine decarboxylase/phosphopantothenate--cysteine ligase
MAEPERIDDYVRRLCTSSFAKLRVLVSVGGTEEDLDPVRVITNRSSGKTGFAIAEAARDRGAQVTVVVGRVSVPIPLGVKAINVRTSAEMSRALKEAFVETDVLVMTAAVSDFAPKQAGAHKKKGETWSLELARTEDILSALGKMKGKRFVIGFALETDDVEENAKQKLVGKNCDLLVANNPIEEGAAFEHDTNSVTIYNAGGTVLSSGMKTKHEIADMILEAASAEESFKKILV